jgi:hypothetical protein
MSMMDYQRKELPQECKVGNGIAKISIPGRKDPLIFELNYATLIMDDAEYESLVVPFDMMKHGIRVDLVPPKYGGTGGITVDGELQPYCFDNEKLYWNIPKPTRDDMDILRWIEINPPTLLGKERIRQRKKVEIPHNIPWEEWRRRLGGVNFVFRLPRSS